MQVCRHSRETLVALNQIIDKPTRNVTLPFVKLAFAIIQRADDDESNTAERFAAIVKRCDSSDSTISNQIFGMILPWARRSATVRPGALLIAQRLFPSAKLAGTAEKDFFRFAMQAMAPDLADSIIADATKAMLAPLKEKRNQGLALSAAQRVAFLITDVWPERQREITAKIDQKVLRVINRKQGTWAELSEIFGG
jgi:hypothetical protein